jgi:hypothetical protein
MANSWRKSSETPEQFSREQHSAVLKRYQQRRGADDPEAAAGNGPAAPAPETVRSEEPATYSAGPGARLPEPGAPRAVARTRTLLQLEQTLSCVPAPGQARVTVTLRLTTACRGQRKTDGMVQAGFLMRLEVLSLSAGARVEGFSLGPWQAEGLSLETGSIVTPEPIWAAFQPRSGVLQGRLLLADLTRHRVLDLPWRTEGLVPGPEAFPG